MYYISNGFLMEYVSQSVEIYEESLINISPSHFVQYGSVIPEQDLSAFFFLVLTSHAEFIAEHRNLFMEIYNIFIYLLPTDT